MFSILIPSFNNLDYLKICLKSIKKNSKFNHQIIIHSNIGSDGTLDFIKENKDINSEQINELNMYLLKYLI